MLKLIEEKTYIDKSTWVIGPWLDEADRQEFRHSSGLPCLIVRGHHGVLCGYVGLPPGHSWHGKDYDAEGMEVDVHGGLTFAGPCDETGKICHVAQPGKPDEVWWLGFDCGHGDDYFFMRNGFGSDVQKRMPNSIMGSGVYEPPPPGAPRFFSLAGAYRDLAYVRSEVDSLAEQCAAVR